MKRYVVTTGKGNVWIVVAVSPAHAVSKFLAEFPGGAIASIIEADGFL